MITRGIVTYSDSHNIKVYVPILQGKVEKKYLTEADFKDRFQGLNVVSVLSTPGLNINYKPGDVVLVGFQDNEMSSVVILGYLGSALNNSQQLSIDATNLNVSGQINFSTDVTFGNDKLSFDDLFIKTNPLTTGIYISIYPESPAKLYGGDWEQITDCFLLAASDINDPSPKYTSSNNNQDGGSADSVLLNHQHLSSALLKISPGGTWQTGGDPYIRYNYYTMVGNNYADVAFADSTILWDDTATVYSGYTKTTGNSDTLIDKNMPPYKIVYIWRLIKE